MPSLDIFGLEFLKTIVEFEISTLKFVKIKFLTHTVNFGIGCTFSKGPGSAFYEDPGPGPGPLYKVCHCQLYWLIVEIEIKIFESDVFFWIDKHPFTTILICLLLLDPINSLNWFCSFKLKRKNGLRERRSVTNRHIKTNERNPWETCYLW